MQNVVITRYRAMGFRFIAANTYIGPREMRIEDRRVGLAPAGFEIATPLHKIAL